LTIIALIFLTNKILPEKAKTIFEYVKIISWISNREKSTLYSCEPAPFYIPDKTLGYRGKPGHLKITIQKKIGSENKKMFFFADIGEDGSRRTRPTRDKKETKKIYLFGDSWLFGWGNNDEETAAFVLQNMFPQYNIENFAFNGYSNVHAYLQLRELSKDGNLPDIALLGYGDYYDSRNCADKEWMKAWGSVKHSKEYMEKAPQFFLPYADVDQENIVIAKCSLFFFNKLKYYHRNIPDSTKHKINLRLFSKMFNEFPNTKFYILFLRGENSNPTISNLSQKASVIDLRPDPAKNEWDDFSPLDDHPGPLAQKTFAKKIATSLNQ